MFTIRKATSDDCKLINELANQVFPATYKEILSTEHRGFLCHSKHFTVRRSDRTTDHFIFQYHVQRIVMIFITTDIIYLFHFTTGHVTAFLSGIRQ